MLTDLNGVGVSADHDIRGLNDRAGIATSFRPVWGVSHAAVYRRAVVP